MYLGSLIGTAGHERMHACKLLNNRVITDYWHYWQQKFHKWWRVFGCRYRPALGYQLCGPSRWTGGSIAHHCPPPRFTC